MRPGVAAARSDPMAKRRTLAPGRMLARLVHISYQLCQPEMLPSITSGCRACEMPAAASLETGRHRMGHGNGTPDEGAEFPRHPQFFPAVSPGPSNRSRGRRARVLAVRRTGAIQQTFASAPRLRQFSLRERSGPVRTAPRKIGRHLGPSRVVYRPVSPCPRGAPCYRHERC